VTIYLGISIHHSPDWRFGYVYPSWKFTWGLTIVDLLAAIVILCCLRPTGVIARLLALRPLRWLGRISYGAYVFHDILRGPYTHIANLLAHHSAFIARHQPPALMGVALVCTILISWLSFRFFESPFLNLKERWTSRPAA
jgi:peptidoglycan/LPS O-acetylase OafA/YrhL